MTKLYVNAALDWLLTDGTDNYLLVDSSDRTPPDYPTSPVPMDCTVVSVSPTYMTITNSLKRKVQSRGAQSWQISLRYGAMTRASFAPLWAFLTKQGGQAGTFSISLPAFAPLGVATGTPLVNGAGQTGTSLITDGWTNSVTVLKAGDWIQIDGDKKVYTITEDAISSGAGAATLKIFPALRKSPPDNFAIYTDPLFTVGLVEDLLAVDFDQCLKARGFEITLQEIL